MKTATEPLKKTYHECYNFVNKMYIVCLLYVMYIFK